MDIYHNAKYALNELLQQAVDEGIPQEEIVYQVMKATDDLVAAKRAAAKHKGENFDQED